MADNNRLPTIFRDTAVILGLVTSVVYLSSWAYDDAYLRQFRIDSSFFPRSVDLRLADGFSTLIEVLLRVAPWGFGLVMVSLTVVGLFKRFPPQRFLNWLAKMGVRAGLLYEKETETTNGDLAENYFVHFVISVSALLLILLIVSVSDSIGAENGSKDLKIARINLKVAPDSLPQIHLDDPSSGQSAIWAGEIIRTSDKVTALVTTEGVVLLPSDKISRIVVMR